MCLPPHGSPRFLWNFPPLQRPPRHPRPGPEPPATGCTVGRLDSLESSRSHSHLLSRNVMMFPTSEFESSPRMRFSQRAFSRCIRQTITMQLRTKHPRSGRELCPLDFIAVQSRAYIGQPSYTANRIRRQGDDNRGHHPISRSP